MRPTGDMTATTDEVIDRFNRAFRERDATLLEDIIALDCVMESVQPAPDGTRYEGYDAWFSSWEALIDDTTSHFEVEDVHTGDEWAPESHQAREISLTPVHGVDFVGQRR